MIAGTLVGCDDEPPTMPTIDLRAAEARVDSAIALFECAYSAFGFMALGEENAMASWAGVVRHVHVYEATPRRGPCDESELSIAWIDDMIRARSVLTTDARRLVPTARGSGVGVYDELQERGGLGEESARLSAIAAIYVASSIGHLGEFLCEASLDGSDLLTATELLDLAEEWISGSSRMRGALGHVEAHGDFAMPGGIAPSARDMAMAVRARIRWSNGDLEEAAADAEAVLSSHPTFMAWITRERDGTFRINRIHHAAGQIGTSGLLGVNDWWDPATRRPNPVTGESWPDPIPFTGYFFLGIHPDGRTLVPGDIPVRWAEEERDNRDPVPLGNGATPDTRVRHHPIYLSGPLREGPDRYASRGDDIPYMTWQELRLIQADRALEDGDLRRVVDLVNFLRDDHDLPRISGDWEASLLADREAARHMLLEERRREFFAEGGRYWSTKIQNTDALWFPRGEGGTPEHGYPLGGAVRQTFVEEEYRSNPYFVARGGLEARGSGCESLPGSQAPYLD